MASMYFSYSGDGSFTDGEVSLRKNTCVLVEEKKESKTMDQAWRNGGLQKTHEKPEGMTEVPYLANKPKTIAANAKPKTVVK